VLLLGAFEGLLVKYWLSLKLPDVLLYGSILGLATLVFGKRALSALSNKRLGESPS
jgi:oligosaccharyltransferase complex subunit delta (ribophorin II)